MNCTSIHSIERLTWSIGNVRKKSYEIVQFPGLGEGDFFYFILFFIISSIFIEENGIFNGIKFCLNPFGGYSLDPNKCARLLITRLLRKTSWVARLLRTFKLTLFKSNVIKSIFTNIGVPKNLIKLTKPANLLL